MSTLEAQLDAESAPKPQANRYGRKRDEQAGPEELLANMNKALPASDEAEKGLLSSLLQDPAERIQETRLKLPPEAFYHEANRIVYEKLLDYSDKGKPVDVVMMSNELREQGLLERIGGPGGLTELFTFVPVPAHYTHYTQIVWERWLLREQIHACAQGIEDAQLFGRMGEEMGVEGVVAKAEERLFKTLEMAQAQKGGPDTRTVSSGEMTGEWVEAFERIVENRGKVIGVQTGWHDVDRTFHGLAPDKDGDFLMIGGFPGMGKTGVAVSLLESIAVEQKYPTLILPLEMGRVGVGHRLYLGRAGVDVSASRSGFVPREAMGQIAKTSPEIARSPIYWGHKSSMTTAELRAEVTMMHRRHGIKCVIIDHFGQLRPSGKRGLGDERQGQIEIMETIHDLRRSLGILFILFVQLDKGAREKQAKNRPPNAGDIRGASELVEYPTHIAFIHRPDEVVKWNDLGDERQELWMNMTHGFRVDCPEAWCDGRGMPDQISVARMDYEEHARFIIAKNRWGATTDEICLRYRKNLQRFVSRSTKLYSNNPKYRQVKLPGF